MRGDAIHCDDTKKLLLLPRDGGPPCSNGAAGVLRRSPHRSSRAQPHTKPPPPSEGASTATSSASKISSSSCTTRSRSRRPWLGSSMHMQQHTPTAARTRSARTPARPLAHAKRADGSRSRSGTRSNLRARPSSHVHECGCPHLAALPTAFERDPRVARRETTNANESTNVANYSEPV